MGEKNHNSGDDTVVITCMHAKPAEEVETKDCANFVVRKGTRAKVDAL